MTVLDWLLDADPSIRWQTPRDLTDAPSEPDPRVEEAIDLARSKQQPDGTWLLENTHRGAVHFTLDAGDGQPSRWNTLRALRVLRWYDEGLTA